MALGPSKTKSDSKIGQRKAIEKTSVALATESSGYVWFRAPVILVNLLILIGISKIIIVGFPYQRTYSYNIDHLCYCWETIYIHSNILGI